MVEVAKRGRGVQKNCGSPPTAQLDEMATFSTQSLDSNSCACIRRRPWHDIVKISRLVVKYGYSYFATPQKQSPSELIGSVVCISSDGTTVGRRQIILSGCPGM